MTTTPTQIDPKAFRDVLGHYPTGVVVVTGRHPDGELLAMVVGTFTSVSLDPPLVAFLPMKGSYSFQRLRECESMCVNVLTGDQEAAGRAIVTRRENKFDGLDWFPSPSGDPVLQDSLAWLDVRTEDVIDAGDHYIVLCRVQDLGVVNPTSPLLFFQGGYGRFAVQSLMARIDSDVIDYIRHAELARPQIEDLADRFGCESAVMAAVNDHEVATIASAVAAGSDFPAGIGRRVPLIPPLGDMYIAACDTSVQQDWIGRATGADDDEQARLQARLDAVRRAGYSVSLVEDVAGVRSHEEMVEATVRYSAGNLTPAQERQIRTRIAASAGCFEVATIDPDRRYDVGSIVVPVNDENGNQIILLRLTRLPLDVSGQQVRVWIEALQAAARRVAARLAQCAVGKPA